MCNCFTCTHSDEIDVLYGYYTSEYETNDTIYKELSRMGYKEGSLTDKGISGLMAAISYDRMAAGCLLSEVEERYKKQHGPIQLEFDFMK